MFGTLVDANREKFMDTDVRVAAMCGVVAICKGQESEVSLVRENQVDDSLKGRVHVSDHVDHVDHLERNPREISRLHQMISFAGSDHLVSRKGCEKNR